MSPVTQGDARPPNVRTDDPPAAILADAIEAFLAPMRCPTTPTTASGMHCAECCYGTGWADVHSDSELEACRALDHALNLLRAATRPQPAAAPIPTGDQP